MKAVTRQQLILQISVPSLSPHPLPTLVDSGCSRSYADLSYLRSVKAPTSPIVPPISLRLFDGSLAPSGPISSFIDLQFVLPGQSSDSFRFLNTQLDSSCTLVLGYDWLYARNPDINWKIGTVTPRDLSEVAFGSFSDSSDTLLLSEYAAPKPSPAAPVPTGPAPLEPLVATSLPETRDFPKERIPGGSTSRRKAPAPKISVSTVTAAAFAALAEDGQPLLGYITFRGEEVSASAAHPDDSSDSESEESEPLPAHIPAEYHDFADVFSKVKADKLPPRRPYDHHINIEPEATPPYGPVYRLSKVEMKALQDFLQEFEAKGFIRSSQSPAGAPVLFAKKKDGSLRLCVDYRGLNNITRKDRYPLPRIDNLLDRLRRAVIFSKMDLRAGYNLIRIAAGDEWKTAFRTRYGSYEFLVMHFGLTNAPATFQLFMNDIFRDLLDKFLGGYLDDLIIFTEIDNDNLRLHISQVREVLTRLRANKLYANPKKCTFHVHSVEFLGYIVAGNGLTMDSAKTDAIASWPAPRNVKDIQSFLGFANFYRRFIYNYSAIVKPLTNLTRKDIPFIWGLESTNAFENLKKAFTTAPILAHFQPEYQTVVETDASDYAIAAVISQENPDTKLVHPVAFFSRSMAPAELNYKIYDKELLAVHAAFKEWRAYLEGSALPVEVITDHKNLEWFSTTKLLTRRQARWSEFLSGFHFVIRYRPGRLGGKPDALTRRPDVYPKGGEGAYALANPQNLQTLFKEGQLLQSLQATVILDSEQTGSLKTVLRASILDMETLRTKILAELPSDLLSSKHLNSPTSPYSLSGLGLLLYNGRVYVPEASDLRLQVSRDKHDHPTAGHQGFRKTLELVQREYYWPDLRKFVAEFCQTCNDCPRNKAVRHKPYGLLKQLPIPDRPWESISMDFIVELPPSSPAGSADLYDSILVIVDRLTKMALFIPTVTTLRAPQLARLYVLHVFSKHGVPSDVVTDRGSTYTTTFTKSLGELLKMKLNFSTAFHPESDGQTERMNQTVEVYLRMYCNYQQDDWVDLLPIAEFAYNNSPHSATRVSPFFANYGFNPRATVSADISVPDPAAHDFAKDLTELHLYCKQEIAAAQAQYQGPGDQRRQPPPALKVGQLVWLNAKNITTKRPSKKLDHKRLGPFPIEKIISSHAFRLKLPTGRRFLHPVFHVSLLEPHQANNIRNRTQPQPPPVEIDGTSEFHVSAILDSRLVRRKVQYLVQWEGYENTAEATTWEPPDNVQNASKLVSAFHSMYPNKPRPPEYPPNIPERPTSRR